jgi:hypothetical protein
MALQQRLGMGDVSSLVLLRFLIGVEDLGDHAEPPALDCSLSSASPRDAVAAP